MGDGETLPLAQIRNPTKIVYKDKDKPKSIWVEQQPRTDHASSSLRLDLIGPGLNCHRSKLLQCISMLQYSTYWKEQEGDGQNS